MLLKIRGPCLSINQYEMAVPLAFQTATDWLEEGRTETVLVGSIDCFSKALHEAALSGRDSVNDDSIQGVAPVGEGSAFFILTRSETPSARCPFVHQVHMETASRPDARPVPNTLILHNSRNADFLGKPSLQATFAHLYGAFPTSMGMDVAAALALLRKERIPNLPPPRSDGGPKFADTTLIACLKKGEAGNWGMIVVGRDGR
jgi:3-oxoacyl-[acyl-carrier-protein] synthase II